MRHKLSLWSPETVTDLDLDADLLDDTEYRLLLENLSDICSDQSSSTLSAPLDSVEQQLNQFVDSLSEENPQHSPVASAPQLIDQPSHLESPAGAHNLGHEVTAHQLDGSVSGAQAVCAPLGAAPYSSEQLHSVMSLQTLNVGQAAPIMHQGLQTVVQPGPLQGQPEPYSQGQIRFKRNIPPVMQIPEGYRLIQQHTGQRKRKRGAEPDKDYVKKPPNAFMLFVKEQRPKVMASMDSNGAASLHAILGKMWRALSTEEQAKYYELADEEKCLHSQQHPDWSASLNYGKKRNIRTDRRKASKNAKASTSTSSTFSTEITPKAKKPRVSKYDVGATSYTGLTEALDYQTYTMESLPSTSYTGVMEALYPQRYAMESLPSTSYTGVMEALHPQTYTMESLPSTSYTGVMEALHPRTYTIESLPSTSYSGMMEAPLSQNGPRVQHLNTINMSDLLHPAQMDPHETSVSRDRMEEMYGLLQMVETLPPHQPSSLNEHLY